jgi:hypothetical protein
LAQKTVDRFHGLDNFLIIENGRQFASRRLEPAIESSKIAFASHGFGDRLDSAGRSGTASVARMSAAQSRRSGQLDEQSVQPQCEQF